ncbi:MAG: type III-A CRISPR-associated RAMP protein Csm4 [Caldilineaceae bacterium SB0665_bin_25]|nr:type III-A CRISPR-associated RAMP protein Csm4 [Caldilineaceae bacterium SB0665_bin_25]
MPHLQPVALRFPQGLHIGARGLNLEEAGVDIPSDTLFSALVDTWCRTGGDPNLWSRPFRDGEPPFLLTSAFPFAGDVRFYPAPVDLQLLIPPDRPEDKVDKPLKRVRFLSEGLLRRALSGQGLPEFLFEPDKQPGKRTDDQTAVRLQNGALCLLPEEADQLPDGLRLNAQGGKRSLRLLTRQQVWQTERTPRVTVDRINSASNIFHAGRTRFAPGCGLWFGLQWRDPDTAVAGQSGLSYRLALKQSLAFLGDEGIGGERSAGYGAFAPAWGEEFHLRDPRPGRVAWLLSRYLPAPAEIPECLSDPRAAYKLVRVGGWARALQGADQRRKQISMLAEGSLIAWPSSNLAGKIENLRPEYDASVGDFPHPVWRSGLAVAVGLKDHQEGR